MGGAVGISFQLYNFSRIRQPGLSLSKEQGYIFSKINDKFPRNTRLTKTGGIKNGRRFQSSLALASFLPRTIREWNDDLPMEIRSEKNMKKFKLILKVWIKENTRL